MDQQWIIQILESLEEYGGDKSFSCDKLGDKNVNENREFIHT